MISNLNPYSITLTGGTNSAGSINYWVYENLDAENPGAFKLLASTAQATIAPFEVFITKEYVAGDGVLKSSIGINSDGMTDINTIEDTTDIVIASKYYNLQGIEVNEPTELGVFIVKQTLKSGKEISIKVVNTNK